MPLIIYEVEVWNSKTKRYDVLWSGENLERAEITINKSYNSRTARRLVKNTKEVLYKLEGGRND